MNNLRRFFTLSAFLALSGVSVAQAQPVAPGEYKLAVGSAPSCSITLSADGTASAGACTRVGDVSHWRPSGSGVQLSDNAGTVVAVLQAKGDGYAGATFADNHKLVMTPAQTAGLAH